MSTTVQAVFANGVFRPLAPLSLPEGQQAQVVIAAEESGPLQGPEPNWISLQHKLHGFLDLQEGWNGYAASPPNVDAVCSASTAFIVLQALQRLPDRLAPSAVGGVGITYRSGTRKAYLECYNSGKIVLLLSDAEAEQVTTQEIDPTQEGLSQLPGKIRDYLDGGRA
jgi:hypothetical protein